MGMMLPPKRNHYAANKRSWRKFPKKQTVETNGQHRFPQSAAQAALFYLIVLGMSTQQLYAAYQEKMQRIADVKNALAVLQWDQETYLPANGARLRGQQISTLSEIA